MTRLDQTLVSRGLARSRTHAARLIAEGKVSSGGEVLAKASLQVGDDTVLDVAAAGEDSYVSRAGHKLAGALDAFPAVDAAASAASTPAPPPAGSPMCCCGGAPRTWWPSTSATASWSRQIRNDPRVSVHEGLNVRYMTPERDRRAGRPDRRGPVLHLADPGAGAARGLHRTGRRPGPDGQAAVRDRQGPAGRAPASVALRAGTPDGGGQGRGGGAGHRPGTAGLAGSPLPGQDGNVEYFLWIRRGIRNRPA